MNGDYHNRIVNRNGKVKVEVFLTNIPEIVLQPTTFIYTNFPIMIIIPFYVGY